ncbi:MAG TPA: FecR domain-containing protein [Rhizomicrobium sp.]|jgi:transmembrane sensor
MSESQTASQVKDRAAEWLQRREFWNWSAADQAELDAWLAQSSAHEIAFIRMEAAWDRTQRLGALRKPMRAPERTGRIRWPILLRTAAACVAIAAIGAASAFYLARTPEKTFATTIGGRETLKLADGSIIHLNTDTVLALRMDANQRHAELKRGEAYFEIHHIAAVPFEVIAQGHRITDLGTKFLVRSDRGELEVSLVEGKARIDAAGKTDQSHSAVLSPGDVAVASAGSLSVVRKSQTVLATELSWQRGVLIFDNVTLAEAVGELGRYNRRKFVIADPAIARRTIYGAVPATDVGAFIRVARDVMGLKVEQKDGEIVFSQ